MKVLDVSEYSLEKVRQDTEFILYRGVHPNIAETTPRSILALSPALEHPAPTTIKKMEREFSLKEELDSAWAIRPIALAEDHGRTMLLFEDPDGSPLDRLIGQSIELQKFLRCGVALGAALGQVHRHGLVHKDLKPSNILVNGAMDQAWITGFGISSRLRRERQSADPPEFISGTLAYMAPEQTGRMNRSIDSRSDLYALGITLYELLTGALPFTASDPMEWVHCHIARRPLPLVERLKDIPPAVSAIIMKLLAKTPEERYQTAAGLESDFRRCLDDWDCKRCVCDFALGEHDRPDRLLISEKLYGREREIETLLAAFGRVVKSGKPELVLVSGYSGIGKSSVVNELHKVLVPPRGLFASGKFEQYKRDIPYSTLGQAMQSLTRRLLAKSEAELAAWRDAMREALGPNGRLMIDLVPGLKAIIGEQPPVPELPPQDAQRRFQLVLRRFIGVFARPEHPLALFLDDLQWLDSGTLEVLNDLLTQPDLQHLLIIGAYRDNEVDAVHPLARKISDIRRAGANMNEIRLGPLSLQHVAQLITDALQSDQERVLPLAQSVYDKTAGNPFFTIQFFSALEHEGLLAFDHAQGLWSWDLDRIQVKGPTDNVVDLMLGKLNSLPAETQKPLQQLACIGTAARVTTLSLICGADEAQVHADLFEAVRGEMVERQEDSYRFIHDRVQEAAYSLIPEPLRPEAHLRIGRILLEHIPPTEGEEAIFEIVNHLNRGAALISLRKEREQLAELNLIAAHRAKSSAAYASALTYLVFGATVLEGDSWEHRHDLTFALELNRAECEYVTGQLVAAEERLSALAKHAETFLDRVAVACLRVDLYATLDQLGRAIEVGLDCLRETGVEWSPHPSEDEVRREYKRVWSQLGNRVIEDLIKLPVLSDPASLATLEILTKLAIPAFATDNNLHVLVSCRAVNLSLERGNCDASSYAYVWMGVIAGVRFGDYQAGYRLGRIGYELVEQHGWKRFQPRTHLIFGALVIPWARPVKAGRDLLRRAFEGANSVGDVIYAVGAGSHVNTNMLAAGDHLADVERVAERNLEYAQKARYGVAIESQATQLEFVRTLRGLTPRFGCFDDFDESAAERRFASSPDLRHAECWYWIRKLQARFFAGEYMVAIEASSRAQRLLWTSESVFEAAEYHLYSALSRAAYFDSLAYDERQQYLEAVRLHQRQLEVWAQNCPENFENRAALVGAEIARIEGRDLDAMRLYQKAIRSARGNGFIHNEALSYERASAFYRAGGFEDIADTYLRNARSCYLSWGADGKVRQLDEMYPRLREERTIPDLTSAIMAPNEVLDLGTVIKVLQLVSGEMILEKLIEKLMQAAIEHAGAERGVLILPEGGQLHIRAEATTCGDAIIVRLTNAPVAAELLGESIIRYVVRTEETVIVDDASTQNPFSSDPYISRRHARSILCLPLINQGKLTGILYLENTLAPRVFTPNRISVLKLLASQAGISLENARLYAGLEAREAKIRRLIEANVIGICIWNLDGNIIDANEAFLNMVGYNREDIASARIRWTDLRPPESRNADARALAEVTATGRVQPYEQEILRKNGDRVPMLAGAVLFEAGGNEGISFFLDLSEQKRAEAEIRALKDQLYRENLALRDEVDRTSMFEEIVGTSKPLKAVLSQIAKVAPTNSTVFITGETGTGKELIARAVHKRSQRAGRTFVSVNCAALVPSLISSELFGYEKGAFTGATQRRLGRFELADGGTIFLDEVGELLPETQAALLRVLQEREFERVGGGQPIRVDVRVITASNRDLRAAVANGTFRQDLFYRLNVFPIEVPPLRDRKDDLLMLVEYFVQRYAARMAKNIRSVDKKTLDLLQSYDWPGNIRELQNVIERSVILSPGEVLSVDELWLSKETSRATSRVEASAAFKVEGEPRSEREIIEAALAETRGRVSGPSGAAARLGIPQSTLASRIKSLKINKHQFKFR